MSLLANDIKNKTQSYTKKFYFVLTIFLLFLLFIVYSNFKFIINNAKYILFIGILGYIYKLMNVKKDQFESNVIAANDLSNYNFEEFVYSVICQCKNQCPPDDRYNLTEKENEKNIICSEIKVNNINENSAKYHSYIEQAFEYLLNKNYLIKKDNTFYIKPDNDGFLLKLSWENIKSLKSENQKIFWLFRKLVVDSLLKKIYIREYKKNLKSDMQIYSVGSTNLTSDYDITLYGTNESKINIMKIFQDEFNTIFNEHSSIVFDTNIYGKAYIEFNYPINNPKEYKYYEALDCKNKTQPFYYLKESQNDISCLMWGFTKYLRDFIEGFDESLYHKLCHYINKSIPNIEQFLKITNNTLSYLQNQTKNINYISLFNIEKTIMANYSDKLSALHDYISIINFYGIETYFTRGAFIDTVVNAQMCNPINSSNKIPLSEVDYLCSILENGGFFFLHSYKTKYFIRVYNTLNSLINSYPDKYNKLKEHKIFNKINKLFIKLKGNDNNFDKNYCNIENDFDLKKCEKFKIFNYIISLTNELLTIYFSYFNQDSLNNITFYTDIVKQNKLSEIHNIAKADKASILWKSKSKHNLETKQLFRHLPSNDSIIIEDIEQEDTINNDIRNRSTTL